MSTAGDLDVADVVTVVDTLCDLVRESEWEQLRRHHGTVNDVGDMRKIAEAYTLALFHRLHKFNDGIICRERDPHYAMISRLWGGPPTAAAHFFTAYDAVRCPPSDAAASILYGLPDDAEWSGPLAAKGPSPLMIAIERGQCDDAIEALCVRGGFFTPDEQRLDGIVAVLECNDLDGALCAFAAARKDDFVMGLFDFSPTQKYTALQVCCSVVDPLRVYGALVTLLMWKVPVTRAATDILAERAHAAADGRERTKLIRSVRLLSLVGAPPGRFVLREYSKFAASTNFPVDLSERIKGDAYDSPMPVGDLRLQQAIVECRRG
jgi:hypothetical protein